MKKSVIYLALLVTLLSSCSWKPEKQIVTKAEVYVPTINIVPRPEPLKLLNADVIVITEKNLEEVVQRVKDMQGSFVVYALDPKSFEALAIGQLHERGPTVHSEQQTFAPGFSFHTRR